MMRVCIGGTFNIIHQGHQLLIRTAVEQACSNGFLFIGIASGDLIKSKDQIRSLDKRKKAVESYLSTLQKKPIVKIQAITDIFGPTLTKDFDVIVVSPETKKNAEHINNVRSENGLEPITIIEIPFVLADDGTPIQSHRIIAGEIDTSGKIKNKKVKQK